MEQFKCFFNIFTIKPGFQPATFLASSRKLLLRGRPVRALKETDVHYFFRPFCR